MKLFSEKIYYRLFRLGVIGKILISGLEIVAGVAFLVISRDTLRTWLLNVFGDEMLEQPHDFLWNFVAKEIHNFATTPQAIWAAIFLSHGIVKIFLAIGLWRNILWTYPVAAITFAGFVIYQIYQMTYTPSLSLALITILDVVLIVLILHEYRRRKKHLTPAAQI
jgi:uncharacterized membrane protein